MLRADAVDDRSVVVAPLVAGARGQATAGEAMPRHPAGPRQEAAGRIVEAGATPTDSSFRMFRSVSIRQMTWLSLLYVACFGIASCVFYEVLQARLLTNIDATIRDRFDGIEQLYRQDGIAAVAEVADSREALTMPYSMGFHLSTPSGDRLAGNVPVCPTEHGWMVVDGADVGLEDSGQYRFYTAAVGSHSLSLGLSLYSLEELRRTALGSFAWALVISLLLAIGGASLFAYRTHLRVQRITRAMDRVAEGRLDARLPVGGHGDEIDACSAQINDALDRLQGMVESVKQVSTDIAHDLKTPLNRLMIQIDESVRGLAHGEAVDDRLHQALDEAREISATFDALLRIAQIEAGARRAQFRSFELREVLETTCEIYAAVAEESGHRLDCRLAPDLALPMFGDRELILQLVVNLVENSIRHCPPGATISIEAGVCPRGVSFTVSDDGPGVPITERERVMQRLYRLEASRTTEGTGLGLSLVKAVAHLHCGVVKLEDNEPGLRVRLMFARDCPANRDA